jgi:hypothetical protein
MSDCSTHPSAERKAGRVLLSQDIPSADELRGGVKQDCDSADRRVARPAFYSVDHVAALPDQVPKFEDSTHSDDRDRECANGFPRLSMLAICVLILVGASEHVCAVHG